MSLREDTIPYDPKLVRFVDLFCGIGGFHVAMEQACADLADSSRRTFVGPVGELREVEEAVVDVASSNFLITPVSPSWRPAFSA